MESERLPYSVKIYDTIINREKDYTPPKCPPVCSFNRLDISSKFKPIIGRITIKNDEESNNKQ